MERPRALLTTRRLVVVGIVFALFVLFDIGLFAWLIMGSLSQREIENVLLETREQAEPLAQDLEARARELGQEDLWVVVSAARETRTYIQSVLSRREVVRRIEIRDLDGKVVYEQEDRDELPLDDDRVPRVVIPSEGGAAETPAPRIIDELEIPIGELGTLVVGLKEEEVQRRIGDLRRDLVRQTSLIGGVTVLLLLGALVAVWMLVRRARGLEAQAVEAERLAYIGTLASGLAHEIRNPLNSLSLNMQMLEEEAREAGRSGGSGVRLLSITRSEISRLERLVTDFLSYAKPRPPEPETIAPRELFERVRQVLGGEIVQRSAAVEVDDRSGRMVEVDPGQLSQLLINLTQNALASTEELGRPPLVRLEARAVGSEVVLSVEDNGAGIPEAEREKVFDLFFSTRKGGTGLGLAIVRRIAAAHDARVEIDDARGGGTVVRVVLPAERVRPAS